MDKVERYDMIDSRIGSQMQRTDNGDWVSYDDYARVLAERDAALLNDRRYRWIEDHCGVNGPGAFVIEGYDPMEDNLGAAIDASLFATGET